MNNYFIDSYCKQYTARRLSILTLEQKYKVCMFVYVIEYGRSVKISRNCLFFYQFFVHIKTGMMYRPTGKYFVTLPSFSCTACLLSCLLPVLPCCRSGMNIATALAPSISCISLTRPPIIVQFLVQDPNTHICHRKK